MAVEGNAESIRDVSNIGERDDFMFMIDHDLHGDPHSSTPGKKERPTAFDSVGLSKQKILGDYCLSETARAASDASSPAGATTIADRSSRASSCSRASSEPAARTKALSTVREARTCCLTLLGSAFGNTLGALGLSVEVAYSNALYAPATMAAKTAEPVSTWCFLNHERCASEADDGGRGSMGDKGTSGPAEALEEDAAAAADADDDDDDPKSRPRPLPSALWSSEEEDEGAETDAEPEAEAEGPALLRLSVNLTGAGNFTV
jgi:hypothetical protein